jgi:hypothetical protein
MAGCKQQQPAKPVAEATPMPTAPARPMVAAPAFKVFHQDGPSVILVTTENAPDRQIAAIVWALHDAERAHGFAKYGVDQAAIDKRDPNATFNIYRGTKCAKERYAEGAPPCGASYHAAGSYTVGSYRDRDWDDGELVTADGKMTPLWDNTPPAKNPPATTEGK